jgi:hypothetical protein
MKSCWSGMMLLILIIITNYTQQTFLSSGSLKRFYLFRFLEDDFIQILEIYLCVLRAESIISSWRLQVTDSSL